MATNYGPERCVSYPCYSPPPTKLFTPSLPATVYMCSDYVDSSTGSLDYQRKSVQNHNLIHQGNVNGSFMDRSLEKLCSSVHRYRLTSEERRNIIDDIETANKVDALLRQQKSRKAEEEHLVKELESGESFCITLGDSDNVASFDSVHGGDVSDYPLHENVEKENLLPGESIGDELKEMLGNSERILDVLRMSQQCHDVLCPDEACNQGHSLFHLTLNMLQQGVALRSNIAKRVLEIVLDHAVGCFEPVCIIPWCQYFYEAYQMEEDEEADLEKLVKLMMQDVYTKWGLSSYYSTYFDFNRDESSYIKESAPEQQPVNNVDFNVLSQTGDFGTSALALDTSKGKMLIFSRLEAWEETEKVLQSLAYQQCQYITSACWASMCAEKILLCQEMDYFESLPETLRGNNMRRFPAVKLKQAVHQLVCAGQFLLQHHVLYINWIASNLSCSHLLDRVKISSLKGAVKTESLESQDSELVEDILMRVSPFIAAPEMVRGSESVVLQASAVWAFGGLVWELSTGEHFHYSLRHCPREEIHKHLQTCGDIALDGTCSTCVRHFVQSLCQELPEKRRCIFGADDALPSLD